jgi:hypothetical protein
MVIYGNVTKEIKQDDELIQIGGILTAGLESQDENAPGVYWSLPLAHLRYYGDPVTSLRSTGRDSSRLSAGRLVLVALGAVPTTWVDSSSEIRPAVNWFSTLNESLTRIASDTQGRKAS